MAHDAFGNGLLRGSKQALVEPDGMCTGGGVEGSRHFPGVEAATEHLRSQLADTARDRTGDKDFHDVPVVAVDSDVQVAGVELDLPGGAGKFLGPVFAIGSAFGFKDSNGRFGGAPIGNSIVVSGAIVSGDATGSDFMVVRTWFSREPSR